MASVVNEFRRLRLSVAFRTSDNEETQTPLLLDRSHLRRILEDELGEDRVGCEVCVVVQLGIEAAESLFGGELRLQTFDGFIQGPCETPTFGLAFLFSLLFHGRAE